MTPGKLAHTMDRKRMVPILQACVAALLFGASAPLAKWLLGEIEPIPLAAFLYLGSGIGLLGVKICQRIGRRSSASEARLAKPDLIWLAGAILAGGVAAPITLLYSLQSTPAATASLLLNFETVATTIIAALVFREAISRRAWWAIALITLSSICLSITLDAHWELSLGALGIILACILWGIDNNLTRSISAKDPLMIVTIKGLGAGSVSLAMAMIIGSRFPTPGVALGAMVLGSLSYGMSIVLFVHAMRGLGAARVSALFGTAPLAGMILAFILFQEFPTWMFLIALPLMVIGTLLLVKEKHKHRHIHETTVHEHAHTHDDEHHEHHPEGQHVRGHSHLHSHGEMAHEHDHMPDLHHRHIHPSAS